MISIQSLLAFFKNEALLRLAIVAIMLIIMYDALWADDKHTPPTTPVPTETSTPIPTPTLVPTPNGTSVPVPNYVCTEWDKNESRVEPTKIFICYQQPR